MKYKPSALVETMSGSQGDSTFSTGRAGDYIRRRVDPAQPRTEAQVGTRSNFSFLSARWRGLTEAQRAGWRNLATGITLTDRYGKPYKPSGQQLFVGANMTLTIAGDQLDDAPGTSTPASVPALGAVVAKRGAAAVNDVITVALDTIAAGEIVAVLGTSQMSAGRGYISPSAFRFLTHFNPGAAAARDIKAAYEARFGRPTIGQKIAVKVYKFTEDNGIKSAEVVGTTTVIAV